MNEWLKKLVGQLKELWSKWSTVQKIILFAVVGVIITGIVLLLSFSSSPDMVPLISSPITDSAQLNRISIALDKEGIEHKITEDGKIYVQDRNTARRMVAVLMREDLIPKETSPWDVFKMDRWSLTDFERNINLREAITKNLEQHIEALDDVDSAKVTLVLPEDKLFQEDQNPVSASIILTPKPGSDITSNRKKIEGIVKLVKFAVEGLSDDNLVISDQSGVVLNDFADFADFDRLELSKRQLKEKSNLENQYKKQIFSELSQIFGPDRVSILKVDIALDFNKETVKTEEHYPIVTKEDNPSTPYDESSYVLSISRSTEKTSESFKGTGFNPEGPPGQEGQTPPAYKELDNLVGNYQKNSTIQNEEVNTRNIVEEKSPWTIKRITIGAALDGTWKREYDDKGVLQVEKNGSIKRSYTPVPDDQLKKAKTLVEHAIGFDRKRGDSVSVETLQFDRSAQFRAEDEKFKAQQRMQQTIIFSIIGVAVLIIAFIIFRIISREMERRRRLREEELARQHQMMREAALKSAEEEEMDVAMSVEERARMEMQENAINMAREHPEDVAQLIRTWLVEE
ncbi:MAG: flagellar M-ring protein FliF [Spirochaetes bacterium]|nr:MAG: flagellar M-ring protein FliF [Spirochaetota bacterium]